MLQLIIFTLFLGSDSGLPAQDEAIIETARKVGQAVVPVVLPTSKSDPEPRIVATAFFIHPDGYLATARHVGEKKNEKGEAVRVPVHIMVKGEVLECKVVYLPGIPGVHTWDIAILRIIEGDGPFPCLDLPDDEGVSLPTGHTVCIMGFPEQGAEYEFAGASARTPILTTGRVAGWFGTSYRGKYAGKRLVLDITAAPGSSGAPVLNPYTQEVVGVVSEAKIKNVFVPRGENVVGTDRIALGIVEAEPAMILANALRNAQEKLKSELESDGATTGEGQEQ